jgi:hypothetical protein
MRQADADTSTIRTARHEARWARVLARIFAALGGRVVLDAQAENSVRLVNPHGLHLWTHRVEVEGVANLAHEIGHLLFADRLDDDHGLDYSRIPYDLSTAFGREVLAEELACCALSCSILAQQHFEEGASLDSTTVRAAVDEWFVEQIEIQPVFYQSKIDLDSFRQLISTFVAVEGGALVRKCDYLYVNLSDWMKRIGAPLEWKIQVRYEVTELWSLYLMKVGIVRVESDTVRSSTP